MKIKICLYFLFIFSLGRAEIPFYAHLSEANGLPTNEVYNIHQDAKGFMWIATEKGLYRYDGHVYKAYSYPNISNKAGSYIKEDKYGRIWYMSFDGAIFYTQNDSLKPLHNSTLSATSQIIIIDDILIYCTRDKNIIFQDLRNFKIIKRIGVSGDISSIYQNGKHFITIGDHLSLAYDKNGTIIENFYPQKYLFNKIIEFNQTQYTLETNTKEFILYQKYQNQINTYLNRASYASINGFYFIDSILWICKKDGMLAYDIKNGKQINYLDGQSISHVLIDQNKYTWISTTFDGIYIYPPYKNQEVFNVPIGNSHVKLIGDKLLFYSESGEVNLLDENKRALQNLYTSKSKNTIYDIIGLNLKKNIPIHEPGNLDLFDYEGRNYSILQSGSKACAQINDHYIAISSSGSCFLKQISDDYLQPDPWDSLYNKNFDTSAYSIKLKAFKSILINDIRSKSVCYSAPTNTIFFATNIGLFSIHPKFKHEIKYLNKTIYAQKIMSYKNKVYAWLYSGDILQIENDQALKLENINQYGPYSLVKIIDSLIILANDQSLIYTPLNDIDDKSEIVFRNIPFNKNTSEINDIALYLGAFYISIYNGIIKTPIDIHSIPEKTGFLIDYLESKNQKIYDFKNNTFPYNKNDLIIHFANIDYYKKNADLYYKMQDGIWTKIESNAHSLTLASLAPGEYSLSFKMGDTIYKNIVSFRIKNPWYQQWWFILLTLSIIILFIYLTYKWQLNNSKKENRLLMEKTNLEKDLRQSMLSSIKAQMNPHFLFNALNTIQSFIISEDKKNASNYLSKFSKLTRNILQMSEQEYITLQEEIETLNLYLELEKMRFSDLIYSIQIDSNINTMQILIPSMIIQPYIENAIKHGLLHKAENKQLQITFKKVENEYLSICIEDNGIGRVKSAEINRIRNEKYKSFATEANLKRIELLNQEKNKIGVEIIDLKNENQEPIGTKVCLLIQILKPSAHA